MTHKQLPQLLLLFLFFTALSCDSGTESQNSTQESVQYSFVKTDSIRINKLETIQVTDYDPDKKRLLAFGTSTKLCLELDMQGNILSEVDLNGEGPGHFGLGMTELGYFGEGKIIHGPALYFTYDKDWQYQSRITYGSGGYSIPFRYIDGSPLTVEKEGKNQIVRIVDHNLSGNLKLEPDHFNSANMIKLFSLENSEGQALLSYPENSIYRTSDLFFANHQPKLAYNATKKQLILALPLEQKLYVYDITDNYKLAKTVALKLTGFNSEPRGLAYGDQHKNAMKQFGRSNELNYVYNMANSSILNLYSKGDLTVVVHKTGFDNNTITSFNEANTTAQTQSKTITSFFIAGKKVYETEERFPRMVQLSERQFLIPNVDEDLERDYNLYDIYELSEKIDSTQ